MKKSLYFSLVLGAAVALGWLLKPTFEEGPARADAAQGQGGATLGNGDVNGDNGLDLSDAIYLLTHLFQGGDPPVPCPGGGDCTQFEANLATCQAALEACNGATPEVCSGFGLGIDEDFDCLTDCQDPDCATDIDCTSLGTPTFTQGNDNPEGYPTYTHDQTGIVFVLLPGGTFNMGSPETELHRSINEGPVHAVMLSPFLISETEVTQTQYLAVTGLAPSVSQVDPQQPVENVSWAALHGAGGFLTKTQLRLPTEAQWEYAARGLTSTVFSWGDDCNTGSCTACPVDPPDVNVDVDAFMWWCANAGTTPHPVAQKLPNDFGLYDMHGNVWEWCEDVYNAAFYNLPEAIDPNPVSTSGSTMRTIRGGSYQDGASGSRSALRNGNVGPPYADRALGFRVVAPAP